MSCQRKEVQPFQPALSLIIPFFYQHTKSIHKATDQTIVSDQIQWIPLGVWSQTLLKFPLKDNTEASTRGCSALQYRVQVWSTSDWVSRTVNRSSRTKNHYASWSDLRRLRYALLSWSMRSLDQVTTGSSNTGSSIRKISLPLWKNTFNVWPSLWWIIFIRGIYSGFIMVYYSCLLPLIFTTMHLEKNLASSIFSTPCH